MNGEDRFSGQRGRRGRERQSRIERFLRIHPHEISPWRIFKIIAEFVSGFEFLNKYEGEKAVTFFGSSRYSFEHKIYKEATKLARRLSKQGFTVITGAGSGIMEAANKGAYDAGGRSLGLGIELPGEQKVNRYVNEFESFHYFFTRKVMLSFASEMYVFFPGGFGTLDEFFELITLVQTKKIGSVPVILVDREFWQPLLDWLRDSVYKKSRAIDKKDMGIYHVVDNADEAFRLIQKLVRGRKLHTKHEARLA